MGDTINRHRETQPGYIGQLMHAGTGQQGEQPDAREKEGRGRHIAAHRNIPF
jgi:hypothetical protein